MKSTGRLTRAAAAKTPASKRPKITKAPEDVFHSDYGCFPHEDPHFQRLQVINEEFRLNDEDQRRITSVLYPGSWIHVTPSLVFSEATYVDSFTGRQNLLHSFFHDHRLVDYLEKHKRYDGQPVVKLLPQDYQSQLAETPHESIDLLISLDASSDRPISTACHRYVRPGGYLYVNDGHGDASAAFGSPELWTLVGAFASEEQGPPGLLQSKTDLERYFVHKKKREKGRRLSSQEALENANKGYSKRPHKCLENAEVYIFRKQVN